MLAPSWKSEIEETVKETANTDREQRKAQNDDASTRITAAIKTLSDTQNTQTIHEDANQKINTTLNSVTIFLVFLTVIFTGLSWCAFREQLDEMRKVYDPINKQATSTNALATGAAQQIKAMQDQLEIMKADQRPWIGGYPETIRENPAVGIYYSLTISNVGKSPAFDVSVGIRDWKQDANAVQLFTEKCNDNCRERNLVMVPNSRIGMRIPIIGTPIPQVGDTAWLISRIDYRDSEGKWHKTGICFTAATNWAPDHRSIIATDTACTIPNSNYAD